MRARASNARCRLGALVSFLSMLGLLHGCRPYPQRPIVSGVELEPGEAVDPEPIVEGLATAETPYLFGIIPRVLEYETYDPTVLARDLERIERAYRARGYYEAKVIAARVIHVDDHYVRIEIEVQEGKPVRVRRLEWPGLGSVPLEAFEATSAATKAKELEEGDIFDEARFEADKRNVERALRARGFAFAKVEGKARVDVAQHMADVFYTVSPGPRARYGSISIVGLKNIPEGPVRDALELDENAAYSSTELEDAERALDNLGVFSRVEILEDRGHPETGVVPLTVRVEESSLHTVRLGGGTRLDVLRLSFHLRTGWEDRNFIGGMRHFTIEARPGITLFPTSITNPESPVRVLGEFHVQARLEQPSFLEGRTKGFVEANYGVFPVLYPLPDDIDPEQEQILGYHEIKTSTGVERAFWQHQLLVIPSYNWQANFPFFYQGESPKVAGTNEDVLQPVRVSFPELYTRLSFDVGERLGITLSNSAQVAGYFFQGNVSDVKVSPELRTYLRKVFGKGTALASRVAFGFLFPSDYGETLDPKNASAIANDPTDPAVIRDQQKLLLRAFYSGGPTSNRGYPLRGVGPHGPIGFLFPDPNSSANCSTTPEACVRPLGGLTLWEFSLEGRFPLGGAFEGGVFVDASDLRRTHMISLDRPHLSPGVGLRYRTPVGPLRLDLAYRVPYAQQIGSRYIDTEAGSPSGRAEENFLDNYWLPLSLYFAIGEAF